MPHVHQPPRSILVADAGALIYINRLRPLRVTVGTRFDRGEARKCMTNSVPEIQRPRAASMFS